MKYFCSTPAVYVSICEQLNAAYGYPNAATKTARTLPLVDDLPSDASGNVYLAIKSAYCEFVLPSQLLPELIAAGAVAELTADQYWAVMPQPSPGLYGG